MARSHYNKYILLNDSKYLILGNKILTIFDYHKLLPVNRYYFELIFLSS